MKKYTRPSTKLFAILSAVTITCLIAGIVLAIFDFPHFTLTVLLICAGGMLGILFAGLFIADYISYLQIDETRIVLHRSIRIIENKDSHKLHFGKLEISLCDISQINAVFKPGDNIFSKDCYFYEFTLTNGDKFTETLHPYGKKQEQEIVSLLKEKDLLH